MIRRMKKVVLFTPKGGEGRLLDGIQRLGVVELHSLGPESGFLRFELTPFF